MATKAVDLKTDKIKKIYLMYLIPSILASLATSIYLIVDTVMIGHYEGGIGILALNLFLPVFAVTIASGIIVGIGGGVRFALSIGKDDPEKAKAYFTVSFILALILMTVVSVTLSLLLPKIAVILGADKDSLPLVLAYGKITAWGAPAIIIAMFLETVIRYDKNPRLAMVAVITGGLMNVVLDYVMIFPMKMGIAGASLATIISYCVTASICCLHFLRKECRLKFTKKIKLTYFGDVLTTGLPSFVIEVSVGFMTFMLNRSLLMHIGNSGIIVYGFIANIMLVVVSIFNGIGNAAQPIFSENYGAGKMDRVKELNRLGMIIALSVGIVAFLLMQISPQTIAHLFVKNPEQSVLDITSFAMRIYFISTVFMGCNIFTISMLLSTKRSGISFLLSLLRGVAVGGILIFLLPVIFNNGSAIWFTIPITEFLVFILAMFFSFKVLKNVPKTPIEKVEELKI